MFWAKKRPVCEATTDFGEIAPVITRDELQPQPGRRLRRLRGRRGGRRGGGSRRSSRHHRIGPRRRDEDAGVPGGRVGPDEHGGARAHERRAQRDRHQPASHRHPISAAAAASLPAAGSARSDLVRRELQPVAVRVGEVDRVRDAVVLELRLETDLGGEPARARSNIARSTRKATCTTRTGGRSPGGPGSAWKRATPLPVDGHHHDRLRPLVGEHPLEAEHVAVEALGSLEVPDRDGEMVEALRPDRGHDVTLRRALSRTASSGMREFERRITECGRRRAWQSSTGSSRSTRTGTRSSGSASRRSSRTSSSRSTARSRSGSTPTRSSASSTTSAASR